MSDLYYYVTYIATGIALGTLVLPYKNRLTRVSTTELLFLFAAVWPYFLLYGLYHLLKMYALAWIYHLSDRK